VACWYLQAEGLLPVSLHCCATLRVALFCPQLRGLARRHQCRVCMLIDLAERIGKLYVNRLLS
jgi:hypothetical protein